MKYVKLISKVIISFIIVLAFLFIGKYLSSLLPFNFPGSIIGLILLYLCLVCKIIKLEWLQPTGNTILSIMALFFIPAAVGIIQYADLVLSNVWFIGFNVIIGIALIILISGRVFQYLDDKK